jgi:hypothetical protein
MPKLPVQIHNLFEDTGTMSSVMTCPNPDCKQALSTSTLPGRFRCPGCGWVLQIRFGPTGVVLQQATSTDSSSEIPLAPQAAADGSSAGQPGQTPVLTAPTQAGNSVLLFVLVGVAALVLFLGIVIAVIVILANRDTSKSTDRATDTTKGQLTNKGKDGNAGALGNEYTIVNKQIKDEVVFHLRWSKDAWAPQFDVRDNLKAVLALEQLPGKNSWFAIAVRDFGHRNPRDGELRQEGQYLVAGHFKGEPDITEQPDGKFLDQRALRFRFAGKDKEGTPWRGVCFAVAYHGLGYWLMAGSSDLDRAEGLITALQSGKELVWSWPDSRKNWKEQPPELEIYKGTNFTLRANKELEWTKDDHAKDDAMAELALYAKHPDERFGANKASKMVGKVLVLVSKTAVANSKAGLEEFLKELTKEEVGDNADYKLALLEGSQDSADGKFVLGGKPAAKAELILSYETEPLRYFLVAVVVDGERKVVLRCECHWSVRAFWKSEFIELLKEFRPLA